jgi:hypothetical protein
LKGGSGVDGGGGFGSKPRALLCYLCGRGFGSASLLIHVAQCEQLFAEREACKPRGDPRRAALPRPAALAGPLPGGAAAIDAFNADMMRVFNSESLVPCSFCGRTFLSEALAHHAKHCTAERPMGRAATGGEGRGASGGGGGGNGAARGAVAGAPAGGMDVGGAEAAQELLPCRHCGRKFGAAAHLVHERVCAKVFGGGKAGSSKRP